MADKRLTQSPQQIRGTAQDFGKSSKGEAQLEMNEPRKDGGPENAHPWEIHEEPEYKNLYF